MILRAFTLILSSGVYGYGALTVTRQKLLALKFGRGAIAVYALSVAAAMVTNWHAPINLTVWLAFTGSLLGALWLSVELTSRHRAQRKARRGRSRLSTEAAATASESADYKPKRTTRR